MSDMNELIEQYKTQIRRLEKRVEQLMQELYCLDGGHKDELYIRIALLNQEIDDMWDSVNMMKGY
jgi:archaellum component FlaC